ncbi:MAG: CARDB domain-containing protein, partial [Chloroflexota bacterium]|nr:CARDB domain-containing protein [Chloroflexota bacterium]
STVDAGRRITYTLHYTNVGDGTATGVVLSDNLPQYTSFIAASDGGNHASGVVSWTLGTLIKNQSGNRTLVVQVTSPLTNGTSLLDTAYIDSIETGISGDSLVTFVRSRPELHIVKQAGLDVVEAGATLTYTISYANTGNANATGVVITDTYDAHVNFVSADPIPDDGDNVWELDLLAGEGGSGTIVVTVTVDVPLTDTLPLTNLVEMTCRQVSDTYSDTVVSEVNSAPILDISIQDEPDPVHAGQIITYTIVYSNTGNANATNTAITATWDSNLGSISANPAPTSGNNIWSLGQLDGLDGYGTIVVTATVNGPLPPEAVLSSSARMGCSQLAGTVSDAEETAVNAVDLELIAGYDDNTVYPGKWVTYTLNYANHGDVPASNVVLTATRPAYTDYRGSGWTTTDGTVYTHSLGTLGVEAGGSVQFVVSIQTADGGGGSLVLPAGLTQIEPLFSIGDDHGTGPDSDAGDNESSPFIGVPDLVIESITTSPETILVGTPVTFTVRIRNQGTGPAWNPNNKGGFYVNVFLDQEPPPSYPSSSVEPDAWGTSSALYPGQIRDVQLSFPGFSTTGGHVAYAKVDNYYYPDNPVTWQRFSLVPESDESNNVFGPVGVEMGQGSFNVYLPLVLRNYH